jgi:hypothetical protein
MRGLANETDKQAKLLRTLYSLALDLGDIGKSGRLAQMEHLEALNHDETLRSQGVLGHVGAPELPESLGWKCNTLADRAARLAGDLAPLLGIRVEDVCATVEDE